MGCFFYWKEKHMKGIFHARNGGVQMAKGKPRWKDLTFEERLVKRVKRMGASENTIQHFQERAEKKRELVRADREVKTICLF